MDSSWIEVLPLPKSRPGWVAAIFLFMLGGVIFLYMQPQLAETAVIEIDSNETFSNNGIDGISQIIYPKFLSPDSLIPITFRISSGEEPTLQIQSIFVAWTCRFYINEQLMINDNRYGVTKDLSILSNEATVNFQMPKCLSDTTDEIQGSFSIILARSKDEVDVLNYVVIEINSWKAITTPVFNVLATPKYGLISIALLALISVWLVEYKNHQDIWLTSKEGWNIARQTFLRALIRFLIILTVVTALLVANEYVGEVIIGTLLVILLIWLFQPNLQSFWKTIRTRPHAKVRDNKPIEEKPKTETLSTVTPLKTKSLGKKKESASSSESSRIKASEKKIQRTLSKSSRKSRAK